MDKNGEIIAETGPVRRVSLNIKSMRLDNRLNVLGIVPVS